MFSDSIRFFKFSLSGPLPYTRNFILGKCSRYFAASNINSTPFANRIEPKYNTLKRDSLFKSASSIV